MDYIYATFVAVLFGGCYAWAAFPSRQYWYAWHAAAAMAALAAACCSHTWNVSWLQDQPSAQYALPWAMGVSIGMSRATWRLLTRLEQQ